MLGPVRVEFVVLFVRSRRTLGWSSTVNKYIKENAFTLLKQDEKSQIVFLTGVKTRESKTASRVLWKRF